MANLLCFLLFQACLLQAINGEFDEGKIKFCLYKRGAEDNPFELTTTGQGLGASGFEPEKETFLFIHGYGGGHLKPPAQTYKNAILSVKDANVVLVNYGPYSYPYMSLYAKARDIGKTCGKLISALINSGNMDISNLTIAGHSFGSHIAAFTANSLPQRVPHIVGLDPAGPYFRDVDPIDRLSEDDADFVECFHSSPVLGINKAIGTVDYFPNGGSLQPGCANTDDNEVLFGTCSHQIVVDYYAAAIKSPNQYPAYICDSDVEAKSFATRKRCMIAEGVFMGNSSPKRPSPGSYYVEI